jgi:hypothetical protein
MPLNHKLVREDGRGVDVGTARLQNPWEVPCWICGQQLPLGEPVYLCTVRTDGIYSPNAVIHASHAEQ